MERKRLRILMLHGRQQNGEVFKSRTTGKKKFFPDEKNHDLIFIQAPYKMDVVSEEGDVYMWWDAQMFDPGSQHTISRTLKFMEDVFREQGPFDGIVGFSQGGILASILCSLRAPSPGEISPAKPFYFRFAIIIAASFPLQDKPERWSEEVDTYREKLSKMTEKEFCPTLHVWGAEDPIVPPDHSQQLAQLFPGRLEYQHNGKHFAPIHAEAKTHYKSFIDRFL